MLRLKQTTPYNCYQACIACLLGIPVQEVSPHFSGDEELWNPEKAAVWLNENYGLQILEFVTHGKGQIVVPKTITKCIICGETTSGTTHAVIAEIYNGGFEVIHDPHPTGVSMSDEIKYISFLIPVNLDAHYKRKH